MTFYKIKAQILTPQDEYDEETLRLATVRLANKSVNESALAGTVYFVSMIVVDEIVGVAIVKDDRLHGGITFPWEQLPVKVAEEAAEEITLLEFDRLLYKANHYPITPEDIIATFTTYDIYNRIKNLIGGAEYCREYIAPVISKDEAIKKSNDMLWTNTAYEIECIYRYQHKRFYGLPCQYTLLSDFEDINKQFAEIIIYSLYNANRLPSRRYVEVDISIIDSGYDINSLRLLYGLSAGATVVIKLNLAKVYKNLSAYNDIHGFLEMLAEIIAEHSHKVATIFEFPWSYEDELNALTTSRELNMDFQCADNNINRNAITNYLTYRCNEFEINPADMLTIYDEEYYDGTYKNQPHSTTNANTIEQFFRDNVAVCLRSGVNKGLFAHKDKVYYDCLKYCIETNSASVSDLQRNFDIGYATARNIIDWMESMNYISTVEEVAPRKILITMQEFEKLKKEK